MQVRSFSLRLEPHEFTIGAPTPPEILDISREKKARYLPTFSAQSPKKKYKSDDIIEDEEEGESAHAGPSSSKQK